VQLTLPATNFVNKSILIAGFTVDENGNESVDGDGPVREDWIYGQGNLAITVNTTVTIALGYTQVWVDASAGPFMITIPAIGSLQQPITLTRVDTTTNVVTIFSADGSTFFGQPSVQLDNVSLVSVTIFHP